MKGCYERLVVALATHAAKNLPVVFDFKAFDFGEVVGVEASNSHCCMLSYADQLIEDQVGERFIVNRALVGMNGEHD